MINGLLNGIIRYRGFIFGSVKRDFQSRYQNSFLGSAWLVLQPVAMILVYTVIFSKVMGSRLAGMPGAFSYSIYLCSGVLTWGLFIETLNGLVNVFISNANVLKKLNFPRICLPIIVSLSSFVNFLIIFGLFLIFLIVINNFPGLSVFYVIPVLIIQMLFTIGLGTILGVMNVFVRDVGQFVGIVLQFWFWLTPIVYVSKILPDSVKNIISYNPMAVIIMSYQNIFIYKVDPDWRSLLLVLVLSLCLVAIGWRMFKKHSADIVDEL
ncbi:MAG: ABC transporter permease [Rhizobium sp.]|uniref:ABC transporter permease n=1 Tax=Rhizobium sp. SYY.PMSO TaxID=3382192 RepID=UPI00398F9EA1